MSGADTGAPPPSAVPDPPIVMARTVTGDVIDGHVHMFSLPLFQEYVDKNPDAAPRWRQAIEDKRFGRRGRELPELGADEMAEWYISRLDDAGVAAAVIMSVLSDSGYTRELIAAGRGRLFALANMDPRDPDAPDLLEREMAAGFRGVKLLPVNRAYRLSDPACRPFFEKAAELRAAIVIHYGVSVDPNADLRYADPVDLSPVARDHPEIAFVIAHFGAGYLGSVLRLGYQCRNVCVDSSGTNNWMDFMPKRTSLGEVFERTIEALGPERVLFGTDSGTTAPYRAWIKYQQVRTLEELGLSEHARDAILRGNAVRIFRLEDER